MSLLCEKNVQYLGCPTELEVDLEIAVVVEAVDEQWP